MAWFYLLLAGAMEIGWPLGFKLASLAQRQVDNYLWIAFAIASMAVSGVLLYLAQREIPMGSAYIVWTGIGGVGTFLVGVLVFGDAASTLRYTGALLVLAGVVLLHWS